MWSRQAGLNQLIDTGSLYGPEVNYRPVNFPLWSQTFNINRKKLKTI